MNPFAIVVLIKFWLRIYRKFKTFHVIAIVYLQRFIGTYPVCIMAFYANIFEKKPCVRYELFIATLLATILCLPAYYSSRKVTNIHRVFGVP